MSVKTSVQIKFSSAPRSTCGLFVRDVQESKYINLKAFKSVTVAKVNDMKEIYMISQLTVKEYLHYDEFTGIFTWLKKPARRIAIGSVAGCLDKKGYVVIFILKNRFFAHRLAFLYLNDNIPPEVDHINHVRNDNRWVNLRAASREDNQRNKGLNKNNKSGVNGIRYLPKRGKWEARIKITKKYKSLGVYEVKEDAIEARMAANRKYGFHENHGNDPDSEIMGGVEFN